MSRRTLASPRIKTIVKYVEMKLAKLYFETERTILKYQNCFYNVRWCSSFSRDILSTVAFVKCFLATKTSEG